MAGASARELGLDSFQACLMGSCWDSMWDSYPLFQAFREKIGEDVCRDALCIYELDLS